MLKIKDNVDLKELEKYGFKLNSNEEYQLTIEKKNIITIIVVEYERTIYVQSIGYVVKELNVLYDLIKADIVEKVEEEK